MVPPASTSWVPCVPAAVRVHPPPTWPVERSTHSNGPEPMRRWLTTGSALIRVELTVQEAGGVAPVGVPGQNEVLSEAHMCCGRIGTCPRFKMAKGLLELRWTKMLCDPGAGPGTYVTSKMFATFAEFRPGTCLKASRENLTSDPVRDTQSWK